MTLAENAFLSAHRRLKLIRHGLIDERGAADFAAAIIRRFDVRTSGTAAKARALSGGNLQKFIVGREILQKPGVLVISQPSWGLDAGAAAAVAQALLDLAEEGAAVLIISQDLDEILSLCDRIAVIHQGSLSPVRSVHEITAEEIGLLMGGVRDALDNEVGRAHPA
jgi:simple sugar transport system ATP-binding protein